MLETLAPEHAIDLHLAGCSESTDALEAQVERYLTYGDDESPQDNP